MNYNLTHIEAKFIWTILNARMEWYYANQRPWVPIPDRYEYNRVKEIKKNNGAHAIYPFKTLVDDFMFINYN